MLVRSRPNSLAHLVRVRELHLCNEATAPNRTIERDSLRGERLVFVRIGADLEPNEVLRINARTDLDDARSARALWIASDEV
jgi:hypothetical protein